MRHAWIPCGVLTIAVLGPSSWPVRPVHAVSDGGGGAVTGSSASSCPVSYPNGGHPAGQSPDHWYHGSSGLWVVLWPNGIMQIPPGNVQRGGWLYAKLGWWRGQGSHGRLTIHGHRLDKPARELRADVPVGYGNSGLQVSALLFPSVGCWSVTGHSGRGTLTFVTRVVKI